jgi:hypothetical protein
VNEVLLQKEMREDSFCRPNQIAKADAATDAAVTRMMQTSGGAEYAWGCVGRL